MEAVLEMTTSYQPLHFYRPCQVTLTCITNGLLERSACWLHHLSKFKVCMVFTDLSSEQDDADISFDDFKENVKSLFQL